MAPVAILLENKAISAEVYGPLKQANPVRLWIMGQLSCIHWY